ncbi:MAG: response regulator transcription factor [Saprospiraceae bacterium]|nr:response regulator transcription factor [Saprospiraceae bacterium]
MKVIRTIIADDQPLFVEGLRSVFEEKFSEINVIASHRDGKALLKDVALEKPDLLILDLNLTQCDGLQVIKTLRSVSAKPNILVFSRYNDANIVKMAFRNGTDGYLLKKEKPEVLFGAIQAVLSGKTYVGAGVQIKSQQIKLSAGKMIPSQASFEDRFIRKYHLTKRELEVLNLITEAFSNKEIAKELFISDQTVSVHRKNIMRKLGVSNTAGLIKVAYNNSLV